MLPCSWYHAQAGYSAIASPMQMRWKAGCLGASLFCLTPECSRK